VTHLLLIASYAPPSRNVAARRTANLAKFLSRRGHRVTLVTSAAGGHGDLEGAARTIRTRDLLASVLNWRRGQVATLTRGSGATYDPRPSMLARIAVPDVELFSWMPFALSSALEVARRDRVDCVVTTSPPASAHLAGLALGRRGIAWVADFRDGWTFEDLRAPFASSVLSRLDRALERHVLSRADRVVATSAPTEAAMRAALPARDGAWTKTITNGFDPGLLAPARPREPRRPGLHRFVYTGRIAMGSRVLSRVVEAASLLAASGAPPFEVVFAGPVTSDEADILGRHRGLVRHEGHLDWPATLDLQRSADTLMVFIDDGRAGAVPAKVFEYLAARVPVLVVGPKGPAAAIVEGTRTGTHAPGDAAAVAARMREAMDCRYAPDERAVSAYSWESLAARYEEELLAAIAAAGKHARPAG
jgi:glycosyltransferase involved in cell wall biosynthesis